MGLFTVIALSLTVILPIPIYLVYGLIRGIPVNATNWGRPVIASKSPSPPPPPRVSKRRKSYKAMFKLLINLVWDFLTLSLQPGIIYPSEQT